MPNFAPIGTALLDFDDTLAVGPLTWGIETFLPEVMARHGLTPDRARLDAALLAAQEMSATTYDDSEVLASFLAGMDWPQDLWADLEVGMRFEFTFSLFDDTLPFLQQLRERGVRAFVVSNNDRSPALAAELGIAEHVAGFITPSMQESLRPKPHPSMFDALRERLPDLDPATTVLIGDDPWSDAAFADACDLPCLLVDRARRYRGLTLAGRITFVDSLAAVMMTLGPGADQQGGPAPTPVVRRRRFWRRRRS
jgi:FMN phosphatase YigB (HAD superfamily)